MHRPGRLDGGLGQRDSPNTSPIQSHVGKGDSLQLSQGPGTLKSSTTVLGWGLCVETELPVVLISSLYYKKEQ